MILNIKRETRAKYNQERNTCVTEYREKHAPREKVYVYFM